MSDVVVDSCVIAKWVLPEADSALATRVFTEIAARGDRFIALDIALPEAANAIWLRCHRRLISREDGRRFVADLLGLPVLLQPSSKCLASAFEIAIQYDRSVYDALFVALAHDMNLPGVTADEPLWRSVHADFPNIVLLRDWR
jgi:predicted nucleic acid-binding protein